MIKAGASTAANGLSGSCSSSAGRNRFWYTAVNGESAAAIPSGSPRSGGRRPVCPAVAVVAKSATTTIRR